MVLFPGLPYPIAMIYIKVAGNNEPQSIPFVEGLAMLKNIEFDYKQSLEQTQKHGQPHYVFTGNEEEGKKIETYVVSKREMTQHLEQDIYAGRYKIADIAIQPADELIVEEVKKLVGL